MTLNTMNRPKSKQTKMMPSLRNSTASSQRAKPEVKAFSGKGVMIGAYNDSTQEEEKVSKTFSGLKIDPKTLPKQAEARYRCQKCYSLNKIDTIQCTKCFFKRDLTDKDREAQRQEDEDLAKAVADWGNITIEELEDIREDILDRISELEAEATPIFATYSIEKLVVIIGNIIKNPHEEKFKCLKMENQVFYSNIGRF